ncbi:hypothetical protein C1H46_031420 [Malus baccata]|uniref:Kinesin motor domain-containing protein n=1 Tax=Malus baccata TaxID=106549 RepID=A0A540L984_MALBA|nr:hypothetical protein C1H46_031420 [Malus baccata]
MNLTPEGKTMGSFATHHSRAKLRTQVHRFFYKIHNEQIGDLLDLTPRNLEIKDDPKNGFYVDNLAEEYVTS